MTAGHKHRHLPLRKGSRLLAVLQTPLVITEDRFRADASKYPWGTDRHDDGTETYYLTVLGVLHRWTGLTIKVKP